jgi:hypothetical protein
MTTDKQNTPPTSERTEDEERKRKEEQSARFAAAEEASRKTRNRVLGYEKLVAFLSALSPRAVGHFLNAFSNEQLVNFLGQVPQLPDSLTLWSVEYFQSLKRPDIMQEVLRLESLGVRREPIVVAMNAIRLSPLLDNSFDQLGKKRTRHQRAKRILAPVPDLLDLAKTFGNPPALISQNMPDPARIASELKLLSSMISWGEFLYDSLGANHLQEVSKFGLASLVHETTGNFLDGAVGKLIATALDHHQFDETGYRVWRINNYERLQQNVPIVTKVLIALNFVVSK